eukprot:scaffold285354_cov41-Tisochrysis_lutea.AAC.1
MDRQQVHHPLSTPPTQKDSGRLLERPDLPLPSPIVRPRPRTPLCTREGTDYDRDTRLASKGRTPPRPRLTFDSTLGYPGEGPIKIATYNLNGTKG